jgi:hypothetical protein
VSGEAAQADNASFLIFFGVVANLAEFPFDL